MSRGKHHYVNLEVTPEIVESAVRRDSSHCVIADALRAALPDAVRVSVDLQTVRFTDTRAGRRYIYLTPARAQVILLGFDQGVRPEPQTIRLGRPVQIVRVGKHGAGNPVGPKTVEDVAPPDSDVGHKVTIQGGKAMGQGALSSSPRKGRRRVFGLRQLTP